MNIIIAVETLYSGGAELFAMRIAEALQERGCNVLVWCIRGDLIDRRMRATFPNVRVECASPLFALISARMDALIERAGFLPLFLRLINLKALSQASARFSPDVVHSHLLKTDQIISKAFRKSQVRHVITIHGDYLKFYLNTPKNQQSKFLNIIRQPLLESSGLVVISEKQRVFFTNVVGIPKNKIIKIYNGYTVRHQLKTTDIATVRPLIFGMISRGIEEKGWQIAIDAFLQASIPNSKLILIGEGTFLRRLQDSYKSTNIVFKPSTQEPLNEIAAFDIGLLPSWYQSESLPTTVVEYLALGKPVIASDAGEIEQMLSVGNLRAGICIPLERGLVELVNGTREAMIRLASDNLLRVSMGQIARQAFQKFDMNACICSYLRLYLTPGR